MASAISSAFSSTAADDEDLYVPQRAPPPIPTVAYNSTTASRAPELGDRPIHQANTQQLRAQQNPQHQHQHQPSLPQTLPRPSTQQTNRPVASRQSEAPRSSGTFSFLRRRSSSNAPAPPFPSAQQEGPPVSAFQSRRSISGPQLPPNNGSVHSASAGSIFRSRSRDARQDRTMLRKQSKLKQQQLAEQERQQRAAQAAANRQPPRLPQPAPLPGIDSFGGADARPDSVAIFNHAYTDPRTPPAIPGRHVPNPADYSSSPGMAPGGYPDSSSSPSYALRGADGSSPPSAAGNGDINGSAGQRTSSMTNRGRYSYASSTAPGGGGGVNSPRRVRRRRDPTPFNVLVVGAKSSGKTSFISFLRTSLALRPDKQSPAAESHSSSKGAFTSHYLESEVDGERIGLTLWDSTGFEKNIVDLQLRETAAFIESKFEETFAEEQKVMRSPGFKDTHIHCVFLVLDPVRLDSNVMAASASGRGLGGLDEDLDLQVIRALWAKTTVIPVISKADTLTINHMSFLKRAVWESIKSAKLNPLDALELEEDDEDDEDELDERDEDDLNARMNDGAAASKPKRQSHARQASLSSSISDEDPYIPMSILSPDPYSMPPYTKYAPKSQSEIGRRFAWGFASPFDPQHCDFIRLRDTIFSEWRADLRDLSRVKWYEQWRTSRLRNAPSFKPRAKAGSAATTTQRLPIREPVDRQNSRNNFSGGVQSAHRSVSTSTHATQGAEPDVGRAVTMSGPAGQPSAAAAY